MKKLLAILLAGSVSIISVTKEDVLEKLGSESIANVDFVFTDLNGGMRAVTIPQKHVKGALQDGLKFDGSSVPGYSQIYESDMHLEPDLESFTILSELVHGQKSAVIICNVKRSETENCESDPRTFLVNLCNKLGDMGYTFYCGPEIEFYLFDKEQMLEDQSIVVSDKHKYFDSIYSKKLKDLAENILNALIDSGINTEKLHHEVAPGQYEVSLRYAPAVKLADNIVLAKHIIKAVASNHGFIATFMPKPIFGQNGSGMHVHYSLWDNKNNCNAFYSAADELYLSDLAKAFLNGNVKYLTDLSAFINPTVNSYKRLVPGYEAPVYVCVGKMNRSAAIRIPLVNSDQPNAVRAELRAPDPACNPYLALSVIGVTGLKGLEENNIALKTVAKSLYKLNADEIKGLGISSLPASLEQAIANLGSVSEQFMGSRIIEEFKKQKSEEVRQYNTAVHWWELEKYVD